MADDLDKLWCEYHVEERTLREVGDRNELSYEKVRKLFIKHGKPIRTRKQAWVRRRRKAVTDVVLYDENQRR